MTRRAKMIVLGVGPLILACSTPMEVCSCPPALGLGIVYGRVTRGPATPFRPVTVRVEVSTRSCDSFEFNEVVDRPTTGVDASGNYRYVIRTGSPSDSACVRVSGIARSNDQADSVRVDGARLRLIPSSSTNELPDSVRVDLQLP